MRHLVLTLLLSTVAICVGCDRSPPPDDSATANDELPEKLEHIKKNDALQRLKEYGDENMKRLLTKTGEGVKTVDWDLSKDNHISLVMWPDDENSDRYFINQDIDLSIRFPAGFEVNERATLLICNRDDPSSDRLHSISFHLSNCTTDEAFQTVTDYIKRWKLRKYHTTDGAFRALDQWHAQAKDKIIGNTFGASRQDNYPIIDVAIRSSFDSSNPWFISITFSIYKRPLPADENIP